MQAHAMTLALYEHQKSPNGWDRRETQCEWARELCELFEHPPGTLKENFLNSRRNGLSPSEFTYRDLPCGNCGW
jgi:hypothetical protein